MHHHKKHRRPHHKYHHSQKCFYIEIIKHATHHIAHDVNQGSEVVKHAAVKTTKGVAYLSVRGFKLTKASIAKARKDVAKLHNIDKLANKAIMHGIAHPKQFLHAARKKAETELKKAEN